MARITDIQPQKKREGYFNIFVDERYFCALSSLSLSTAALRVGSELSTKELHSLRKNAEFSKAYSRALYYLRYGPRTSGEMKKYLLDKGFDEKATEYATNQLIEEHYIDDALYIQNFIESRRLLKPRSMRQLQLELIKKRLDKDLIQEHLLSISEDFELEAARSVFNKKSKLSQYKDTNKMTQYLLRQGFAYSTVKQVIHSS